MFQLIRKWKWIIASLVCFGLLYILPAGFIEKYYSNGLFLFFRKFFDNTFGQLPFPAYYIFIGLLLIIVLKWFLHFFREKPQPVLQRIFKIASFAGFMITLFYIFWGFNYGRIPIEEKLDLTIQPLTQEQLVSETNATITQLANIRRTINKDTNPIPQIVFINNIELNSRDALNSTLNEYNYNFSKKIRGRFVYDDMFLVFSVGGQYLPYAGECNVDNAVFYSKKPFYLIHEMAHGNGIAEEAACNFLAYISCVNSTSPALQYSGELNYLLYLLAELKSKNESTFKEITDRLPLVIKKDLNELKVHTEKHTFKTGIIGDVINNFYLKLLGINEGVKNYDKMVLLVYAWKIKTLK